LRGFLKECFALSGGLDEEPRLEQIFTWFYDDEGGSALDHPFRQVWVLGGKYIALKGKATASLKNLVPLHKEKECSAYIIEQEKRQRNITWCECSLRRR
jgi:hypothetical protein